MIAALAFVPLDKVIEYFEQLQQHFSDAVILILDYFEDNHVGRPLYAMVGDHPSLCTICGTSTRELMPSFQELIIQLKAGIAVFRLA